MTYPKTEFSVIKASGERKQFSVDKLKHSLLRAGASGQQAATVIDSIIEELYDGITTKEIYSKAFKKLEQFKTGMAAKYKLKNALTELGPTGFPFEQFVAKIFQKMGYHTQTGVIVQGKCVSHEVDVVARNEDSEIMVECKFHHEQGKICDVKVPLYISARFWDIQSRLKNKNVKEILSFKGYLVTNTRFSSDALTYGLCAGLEMLSWDFPAKGNLKELIDKYKLHPITCLTTLTPAEKQQLLNKKIVLCSDLKAHHDDLMHIVKTERFEIVIEECNYLSSLSVLTH